MVLESQRAAVGEENNISTIFWLELYDRLMLRALLPLFMYAYYANAVGCMIDVLLLSLPVTSHPMTAEILAKALRHPLPAPDAIRRNGIHVCCYQGMTPAGWFSWKTIYLIEKHTMALFFSGKSENRTSDIYMEIRNSIMKKFHADPQTPVELKDLSELSTRDMDARQQVLEFLDHWDLINFHPFPPSNSGVSNSDANGAAEASSLFEKLYQFKTVQPVHSV